jgi:Tol biopolymer transport system component
MKRVAVSAVVIAAMVIFGVGAYNTVGSLRGARTAVQRPSTSLVSMPGTIYVAQGGAIYRLRGTSFKQITPNDGWEQPAVSPDGKRIVAVKATLNSSDLFLLDPDGRNVVQLTHNSSQRIESNHWSFFPHFSGDGSSVFYSYDPKDSGNTYRVDLAVFSRPTDGAVGQPTSWTQPNQYTGGDTTPIPLPNGLIFTRYSIDAHDKVHSQVWLQAQPGSPGVGLTAAEDDCAQPSVSPDGRSVAMVCRHGQLRSTQLAVAALDVASSSIGTPTVLVAGELVASPSFSWNGSSLAYLAPAPAGGAFQLWTVALGNSATGPRQVTQNLGLDPSSAPAWTNDARS